MKPYLRSLCVGLLAAFCGGIGEARGDGMIVIHNPPPVTSGYAFAPLEVKYHHVTAKVTGQVAVTEVDQSFYNPNDQRLEGTYMFPVPKGARIDKFSMDINGKMMDAELLDAEKARKIYEDIVRKMKDPALLEYVGQAMFKLRIFPIEPKSDKRIKLKYTQLLQSENGLVGYTYPLNTEKFSAALIKSVSLKVELECKQDLKAVYSPSHQVDIQRHERNKATIGFEASNVKPDTDFQLFFSSESKHDVSVDLLSYNDGTDAEGGSFLLTISPKTEKALISNKDIVFVMDTSASMADNGKLDQAKRALLFCLKNLESGDRFEIVRFSTEAEPLFGTLVETTDGNRAKAEQFIKELKPIGGTAIEAALLQALEAGKNPGGRPRPFMVVFLTDGKPTMGNMDENDIVAKVVRAAGERVVRVFCFGIGTDVNTHLLDKITEKTRAASQYVLPNEDIEVKVSNFYTKISQPVLADVKLAFSGGVKVFKMAPAELPDLFQGEQLVVFGRYTGSGDAAITLEGAVNGARRTFTYEKSFAARAEDNAFIPRLWATRRVGYLLDQIRLNGDNKEVRDEVTALARQYGIVTPYTAYLIVEDESRRNIPVARRTLQTIDGDTFVRKESSRMFAEVNAAKSGHAAVGGAQAFDSLKRAAAPSAAMDANLSAQRGQIGPAKDGGERVQAAIQNQQTRNLAGRTFYQNGAQWVDSAVQQRQNARRVQVKFNTDEYFALMKRHVNASQWMSVGRNVQLVLDDTIYEVVD